VRAVAEAIVKLVDLPFWQTPRSGPTDPSQEGREIVDGVAHRIRTADREALRRIGREEPALAAARRLTDQPAR
jgi:hypothetical protein